MGHIQSCCRADNMTSQSINVDDPPCEQQKTVPATLDEFDIKEKQTTQIRSKEEKEKQTKISAKQIFSGKQNKSIKTVPLDIKSSMKEVNQEFQEDLSENHDGEIEMKKVKVKWNQFIKMKNKKFTDDYQIIKQIGKGGFGCVYKVKLRNTQIFRAAKRIDKDNLKKEQHENLLGEMAIMMSLDHPNIVRLFEVYDQKNYYVMVMELCEGGELFHRIVNYKIAEEEAVSYAKQILSAIFYMHSKKIVHRDIKPENLLIEKKTRILKLIDFGISTKIRDKEPLTQRLGTPFYLAPEILAKRYNEKCDLWSIGIVVYMTLTGSPPFKGQSIPAILESIINDEISYVGKCWKNYSIESVDFLKKLLVKNPKDRMTAKKALNHPWLNRENKKKIEASSEVINRMENFRFKDKLQAVVYTYIVSQLLTSAEKMELLENFRNLDKNKNGVIEIEEIRLALASNASSIINQEKIKKMLDYIDTNCSGQIDYTQFMVSAIELDKKIGKEHFEQAFAYFDIDNSGAITFEEVSQFLQEDGQYIEEIFKAVDENGDGLISKEEFVNLLLHAKSKK